MLAIDRLLGRTPGLMDAQQTDSASPASRPASGPPRDGMSSLGGCRSPLAPALPPSDVNPPERRSRLQPDAELSCVPKWRFISKHEVDYCSLALLPMRR